MCKILRKCDLPIEIKDIQSISPTLRFAEVSQYLSFIKMAHFPYAVLVLMRFFFFSINDKFEMGKSQFVPHHLIFILHYNVIKLKNNQVVHVHLKKLLVFF